MRSIATSQRMFCSEGQWRHGLRCMAWRLAIQAISSTPSGTSSNGSSCPNLRIPDSGRARWRGHCLPKERHARRDAH